MKLAIYGAGGLGREVFALASVINEKNQRWTSIFFIDDIHPNRLLNNVSVIEFSAAVDIKDIECVVAVGEPMLRNKLIKKIKASGIPLATLVHPDVDISTSTFLGEGVVVCKQAFISCDCVISNNAFIQPQVYVGHDCHIGESSVISPGVMLGGNCKIGSGVFIGMNACIKENKGVGNSVIIGMGAVVVNDIEENIIASGNPARVMRSNDDKNVFRLQSVKNES